MTGVPCFHVTIGLAAAAYSALPGLSPANAQTFSIATPQWRLPGHPQEYGAQPI